VLHAGRKNMLCTRESLKLENKTFKISNKTTTYLWNVFPEPFTCRLVQFIIAQEGILLLVVEETKKRTRKQCTQNDGF